MLEKSEFHFKEFHKICPILNTITKMDVRFIDQDGNALLQLVNHHYSSPLAKLRS